MAVVGFLDLGFRADAGLGQVGGDSGGELLAFTVGAIHPDSAEAAHGELVDVQHDDLVATVAAELAGELRGGCDVAGGIDGQQDGLVHVPSLGNSAVSATQAAWLSYGSGGR